MSGPLRSLQALFAAACLLCATPALAQGTRVIEVTPAATAQGATQAAVAAPLVSANVGNPSPSKGREQRLALVIGNSSYRSVTALPNPANDARSVSQLLTAANFEVILGTDLTREEMTQVVQDFAARIAERGPDTVALVYYAGHGLQLAGENYLVPVDAQIRGEGDVAGNALRLVDLMSALDSVQSRTRVVILDACRNSPFPGLAEAGRGLAIVDAPNGSIVAYSTAPGAEAFDGTGANSPYTGAFLKLARTPNLPIEQFFKRVRLLVNDTTDGRQTPWESSSLTSDFFFFTEGQAVAGGPVRPKPQLALAELRTRAPREAYRIVIEEDVVEYYEEFIRLYPEDLLALRIRALLAERLMMLAWYEAVKANTPFAYKAFQAKYSGSLYARQAVKLEVAPKPVPLTLPSQVIRPVRLLPNITLPRPALPKPQDARLDPVVKLPPAGVATLPQKPIAALPNRDRIPSTGVVTLPSKGVVTLPPRRVITLPPGGKVSAPVVVPNGAVVASGAPALQKGVEARAQLPSQRGRIVTRRCIIDDLGRRLCR